MISTRHLPHLACLGVLTACAANMPAPAPAPPAMAMVLADADAAVRGGRNDQALAMLKSAALANPTDKAPWLRMAQLRFEEKNYGETIVNGLAVIERDPDDMLAYSLVAASGLRVSAKALADLSQKNGFAGSVRSEAQDLANLLHSTLKEKVVPLKAAPAASMVKAPAGAARASAAAAAATATATTSATTDKPCAGTFCLLDPSKK
ncbi:MAG: hypothetical protein QFF03_10140 [Pseudomonadota bacterium]|nr:hypothetical protein [Pseudomonadota bacterium]